MNNSDPPSAAGATPVAHFDAFVSYASAQRRQARAIQLYLQRRVPAVADPMTVYLDETDIRGGDLQVELGRALDSTRQLIVCCSPEAADSRWVSTEIARFLRHHQPHDIVLAWLDGPLARAVPSELDSGALRVHDLRRWWFNRWPWPRTGIELARMLARLADVPMRQTVDWERRRMSARLLTGAVLAVAVGAGSTAGLLHQTRTAAANRLLDALAVDTLRNQALGETQQASIGVRQRGIALVASHPERAAMAVQTGWPVAAIGLDAELAAASLSTLRGAIVTREGEWIPAPRMANYRYAIGLVQEQAMLRHEARALLQDVHAAEDDRSTPDGIYWQQARRSALMTAYLDVLERLDDPASQLDDLHHLASTLETDAANITDLLPRVQQVLHRRGVSFAPLISSEAEAVEGVSEPPVQPVAAPGDALRRARERLIQTARPEQSAAKYALALETVRDADLIDAELAAVEALRAGPGATRLAPELLKMAAALAAARDDEATTRRVAGLLAAALPAPAPSRGMPPPIRGAGFVNFPAPLAEVPVRMLQSAEPTALVHFVARYASLARPGLSWTDLSKVSRHWKDVAAKVLGPQQLATLIRAERGYLDTPLYAPWHKEMKDNCVEWVALLSDTTTLAGELSDLARRIASDPAAAPDDHLLAIYQAASHRLWIDLKVAPDRQAVADLLDLMPHPMWSGRLTLSDALLEEHAPAAGQGLGPFLAWAARTHGLSPRSPGKQNL